MVGRPPVQEGHIVMATGRGQAEVVLTPLAEQRDTQQPQRGPTCR